MTLLTARDYHKTNPTGGIVFDALGREIPSVAACDTVTGEVIRVELARPPLLNRVRSALRRHVSWLCIPANPPIHYSFLTRHGFWPAPLRIVPSPAYDLHGPGQ